MLLQLTELQKNRLLMYANKCVGISYKFGAEVINLDIEPNEIKQIDCSELMEYLFHKIGIIIPDGSYNQYAVSELIDPTQMQLGDLVFRAYKDKPNESGICHVGLCLGDNRVIEAAGWTVQKVRVCPFMVFAGTGKQSVYMNARRLIVEKIKFL